VERHVHDGGLAEEDVLGAVAVVGVVVDDQHPFSPIGEGPGRDRDVVDEAETHGPRRRSVMARWPHGEERRGGLPCLESGDGVEAGAGGKEQRVVGVLAHRGIAVDVTAAGRNQLLDGPQIPTRMHPRDLLGCRPPGLERDHRVADTGLVDALEHRGESGRPLGVAVPRIMQQELRVGGQQDAHDGEASAGPLGLVRVARFLSAGPRPPGGRSIAPVMPMGKLDVVQWGPDRLRIGPWRGGGEVASIVPAPGQTPSAEAIERALSVLAAQGYRSVITSALTFLEQQAFMAASFTVHERLHLLRHDLQRIDASHPSLCGARLRRGRRGDRDAVLAVDRAAFDAFWRFDEQGLTDARRATPSARLRVVDAGGVVAYAVTGRAGTLGYLQRLAVHPSAQGRGLGTALVIDGLHWARRHGATAVLVNTQEANVGALDLYEQLGFVREAYGLAVLERSLDGTGVTA